MRPFGRKGKDTKVVIVGHLPFVNGLRGISRDLKVIEKNPCEATLRKYKPMSFCLRLMSWASQGVS